MSKQKIKLDQDPKWTVEIAIETYGFVPDHLSQIEEENITDADHYLLSLIDENFCSKDTNEKTKVLHYGIARVLPYITKLPSIKKNYGCQTIDEVYSIMIEDVIDSIKFYCKEDGIKVPSGLFNKLRKRDFNNIDEWFIVFDAIGTNSVQYQETKDFYVYAERKCYPEWFIKNG